MANPTLESIVTYPIKGFPGVQLEASRLLTGKGLPNDRRFAVTRGTKTTGDWMPARSYYINAWVDGMMKFSVLDSNTEKIIISNPAGTKIELRFDEPESLDKANKEIKEFMHHVGVSNEGPWPQIAQRNDRGGNWDFPDTAISIINAETVREISTTFGKDLDPVRFRGNLVIGGTPAWSELEWKGKKLKLGDATLEVMRPIVRCPTPGVNPSTGERDISFETLMPEHYGHAYCGMYAVVTNGGQINVSDKVEVVGDAEMPVTTAAAQAEDYRLWPRIVEISHCEIGNDSTRLSLRKSSPWPLPQASPGQRLRLHLGSDQWTVEHIVATSPGHYHLEVERSLTGDPVTEMLRTSYKSGDKLVISGPFGKV